MWATTPGSSLCFHCMLLNDSFVCVLPFGESINHDIIYICSFNTEIHSLFWGRCPYVRTFEDPWLKYFKPWRQKSSELMMTTQSHLSFPQFSCPCALTMWWHETGAIKSRLWSKPLRTSNLMQESGIFEWNIEGRISKISKEILGSYRVGKYFRQKKNFEGKKGLKE